MKIYRMHRGARAAANYSGAMEAGGRWNPIGTPMLYTAQHLSLACVEILVHLDKSELPRDYVWSWTELEGTLDFLQFKDLDHVSSCQAAGHSWVDTTAQPAIQVPSVVIPEEFNILLNPNALGICRSCLESEPRPFRFDPRLFGSQPQPCSARS
ncbi:MAG: RES family NAD+ phosphorylase [Bryobacteraceae bacterium]|jgi:RES domain-containing protein